MIPSTVVNAEKLMLVMVEELNVAVSAVPLGGPPADQLSPLFQSPDTGLVSQVALPASPVLRLRRAKRKTVMMENDRRGSAV